jgi:hypothetical protein
VSRSTSWRPPTARATAKLSKNRLEIWATDADGTNNRLVAFADQLKLTLTRGYLHLQDARYNAAKDGNQPYRTYHWDNVEFDGKKLGTTRSYQVPDSLTAWQNRGDVDLGYTLVAASGGRTFSLPGVNPSGAKKKCATLRYRVHHGTTHTFTFPKTSLAGGYGVRPAALPVPLSELRTGTNTITLIPVGTDDYTERVANMNLFVETS